MRAAKLVHELLPEHGAALFEQLGANAQRAARGPVAKSPAAELREHGYELDRGFGQAVARPLAGSACPTSEQSQLTRARTLIEPRGGQIVAEFFDIDKSRSIPPARRPRASALLAALADPNRGFEAVVVGEPQRAFYGNQFGNTFPVFAHYGVPLWVPEVGGPIDPDNEAHDLIMSVFGGVSKGERNRIKIRVSTAMAARRTWKAGFWAAGRLTDTSWSMLGRTQIRPRRSTASDCTPWKSTTRPPGWSSGFTACSWTGTGSWPSPSI